MVRQIMRIADRYFNAGEAGRARVWPFRSFTSLERRIGVAMVIFLVLINQVQVGIIVRLNFFNRDLFNAIQNYDAVTFWHQLLFVFTPFAFLYVATTVIEFFTQSMLVIRWRRWLTDHFVSRWLARHNHYRISLVAGQTDNPDQRIAEDVYRFINGGSDGSNTAYGIYDFSILLISTVSSLVSFAVETKHLVLAEGENVVLSGPSGSGKSTLFRAIAGIWPFGEGRIHIPAGIRVMVVPAKPYIPISTFRAAVTYPAVPGTYSDDDIRRALDDTHLGDLVNELDREEVWSQRLSSGEQQRVALARALLMRPDWLFLDKSTSAVDEKLEAKLYAALARRLPKQTIMSIGHRSTVVRLHQRHLEMYPESDHFTLYDTVRIVAPAE